MTIDVATSDHALAVQVRRDSLDLLQVSTRLLPAVWPIDVLDTIPFHRLSHANGSAHDLPAILRSLHNDANELARVEDHVSTLSFLLINRGTLYDCAQYAVPFLTQIVLASRSFECKLEILRFMVHLAMTSTSSHFPAVRQRVRMATTELVRTLCFSPHEPNVKNLSACFLAFVAPPDDYNSRELLAAVFEPATRGKHSKFRMLASTVREHLLVDQGENRVDFEQLETELFESAEEWEAQACERERLIQLCKYNSFKTLPTDVQRMVKAFLYEAVEV